MDLRVFYQKLHKIESEIAEPSVVIVSRETPDGGKQGVKTEVPRRLGAHLIAEEKATLASAEEAAQFREEREARWRESQSEEPPPVSFPHGRATEAEAKPGKNPRRGR